MKVFEKMIKSRWAFTLVLLAIVAALLVVAAFSPNGGPR